MGMAKNNQSSHFTGVSWYKCKQKWHAYIKVQGRKYHIGYYDDPLRALIARIHWMKRRGLNAARNMQELQKVTGYDWIEGKDKER